MRKQFKLALALVICITGSSVIAQDDYVIEFTQTMQTDDATIQETLNMMGEMTTTWFIKGSKFRSETVAGMAGTRTVIYDGDSKDLLMLMQNSFARNSYMMKKDTAEVSPDIIVKRIKEKKEILGYNCVKYVVTDAEGNETILYTTKEIENPFKSQFGDSVKGAALLSVAESNVMGTKMKVIMTAKKVKKKSISDKKFSLEVPEGYTEMNMQN